MDVSHCRLPAFGITMQYDQSQTKTGNPYVMALTSVPIFRLQCRDLSTKVALTNHWVIKLQNLPKTKISVLGEMTVKILVKFPDVLDSF